MPSYPATYFWKPDGAKDVHWHYLCDHVPVRVEQHPRWRQAESPPAGREACPDCAMRDGQITVV